jgi:hypothetical protein
MLYCVTGAINSSFWPDYAVRNEPSPFLSASFPREADYAQTSAEDAGLEASVAKLVVEPS